MRPVSLFLLLSTVFSSLNALATIQRAGRYLYNTTDGSRFYIKGVAYQPQGTVGANAADPFPEPTDFIDPLADSAGCNRDLPLLQQLGINTVRVYSVNASLNHDSCVQSFANSGIYLLIDLSLPVNGSIDRASPAWTTNLLDLYIDTIDVFLKYPNILGFNVGNEVVNSAESTSTAPFIKAAARDVKAYLKSKNSTALVGYSSVDGDSTWKIPLASFLACDSESDSLDLYGLNNYEWCGDSNFQSAYSGLTGNYAGYNIPAYFSEFGCNTSPPRLFTEVAAMFGPQMTPVFSGGIAFSYFPATVPGFSLVNLSSDGTTVTPNDDFNRLQTQYANVTFQNSPTQSAAGQTSFPSCPQQNSSFFASTTLPPTPNDAVCSCVTSNSFSCLFTPETTNTSSIVGELLNEACGDLGQNGANCDVIGGNGTLGTYGQLSFCDPNNKLSWAFSAFYEVTKRNPASCQFAGNATVNTAAPGSSSAADAAASSCIASAPSGTFVPSAAGTTSQATPTSPGNTGGANPMLQNAGLYWRALILVLLSTCVGGLVL